MISEIATEISTSALLSKNAVQASQSSSDAEGTTPAATESNLLTLEDFERITMARLQALADCA